jgi:hypothetical protein
MAQNSISSFLQILPADFCITPKVPLLSIQTKLPEV